MKFKLDENFGTRTQKLFRERGYDIQTVREERLQGAPDTTIYAHCSAEHRCLITLDLDFADVLRFPPDRSNGIVVFRLPVNASIRLFEEITIQLLQLLEKEAVGKRMWVVEPGRVRIHETEE